jgi:hypothetical protein
MVYSWSFAPQRRNRPGEREGCVVCGVSTTLGLSQNILTIFAVSQPSKPTPTTQPGMELGSCHLMASKVSCPNEIEANSYHRTHPYSRLRSLPTIYLCKSPIVLS